MTAVRVTTDGAGEGTGVDTVAVVGDGAGTAVPSCWAYAAPTISADAAPHAVSA